MKCYTVTLAPNGAVLTCYVQAQSPELPQHDTRPAMLVFPGGAYRVCSDREAEPIALAYLRFGYNAFVLRYTVTGRDGEHAPGEVFRMAMEDAEAALAYLRANAAELHIDPQRIAVVGFSAGGNLAAALGTLSETKPAALVLGYASVDDDINRSLGVLTPTMLEQVTADTPPTFLFATQGDTVVPASNSLRFALELAERRIPYELHIYATGDHGLSLATKETGQAEPDVAAWLEQSVRFLAHLWSGKPLVWGAAAEKAPSVESRVDVLLANPRARAVLEAHLPDGLLNAMESRPEAAGVSLRRMAQYSHGVLSEETLAQIDEALAKLN